MSKEKCGNCGNEFSKMKYQEQYNYCYDCIGKVLDNGKRLGIQKERLRTKKEIDNQLTNWQLSQNVVLALNELKENLKKEAKQ